MTRYGFSIARISFFCNPYERLFYKTVMGANSMLLRV